MLVLSAFVFVVAVVSFVMSLVFALLGPFAAVARSTLLVRVLGPTIRVGATARSMATASIGRFGRSIMATAGQFSTTHSVVAPARLVVISVAFTFVFVAPSTVTVRVR